MPDFSTIIQTPEVRAVVQEGFLERAFHDALFPNLVYRGDVTAKPWPNEAGDTYIATGSGLMTPDGTPLRPGQDPDNASYPLEQWETQLNTYGKSVEIHMPTRVLAIVDLMMQNTHKLGLQAGQTLNRLVRARMHNAAEAGWTVAVGSGSASTSLRVKRLNGLTKARNPNLSTGSRVRFSPVSSSNPLSVSLGGTTVSVIGFTSDTTGDEIGPGVLTLAAGATWADRAYVKAWDASEVVWVGGGNKVDDISAADLPRLADIRTMVTRFRKNNVPRHEDGNYHVHVGPTSEAAIMSDTELQRALMGTWESSYMYHDFAMGRPFLNCVFVRNNEAPQLHTVYPYDGATFSQADAFAPELTSDGTASGSPVHRMLFSGFGGIEEYYQDGSQYLSEAGLVGKMGKLQVSNNGIEVNTQRIDLIMRAPLNKFQDMVSVSWRFVGDWPVRTDACAPGTNARIKRFATLVHGEPA